MELRVLSARLADTYSVFFVGSGELLTSEALALEDVLLVLLGTLIEEGPVDLPFPKVLRYLLRELGISELPTKSNDIGYLIQKLRYLSPERGSLLKQLRQHKDLLLDAVSEVSLAVSRSTGKKILIVADDFDRLTPVVAESLFVDYQLLRSFPFSFVATVPLTTFYSEQLNISHRSAGACLLPVRPQSGRAGASSEGRDFLVTVLSRRVPIEIFDDEALEMVLAASGGLLRQLLSIVSDCILERQIETDTLPDRCITERVARSALKRATANFGFLLTVRDLEFLREVASTGDISRDRTEGSRQLLLGSVLQYEERGESYSYGVNPLVEPLLLGLP